MKSNESELVTKYLKEVYEKLDASKSFKSVFISELTNDIELFTEETGKEFTEISELYEVFGTPEHIADTFKERTDYRTLLQKAKKKTFAWRVIGVGASILLVLAVILLVCVVKTTSGNVTVTDAINF